MKILQEIEMHKIYPFLHIDTQKKIVLIYYLEQDIVYLVSDSVAIYFKVSINKSDLKEIHFSVANECLLPFSKDFTNYAVSGQFIFFVS